ncbi:hypothetical protein NHX12_007510 [Muraenolepis orangiensis]|uniref:Poly [ADP-ribose] polymerase n=1 Tax=Muraenolepis orangiensis TaxID=630683 RepID=A0A9Q0DRR2_9TELE|nr:hypothetical protein NHX12_007510 [Muraenolepis orangiensis]
MEDVCTFALVVELGEHNVPRLKNKLVKHFQSKKRADGGECQIDYEERSGTATLRFRKEEDRARVLAKQSHVVDGLLTVTVHLPEEQLQLTTANKKQTSADRHAAEDEVQVETASREEQTEEPALCSTSAVLENIPQDTVEQLMELLVENICNKMSTQHEYSLEILSDICSAVVTFSSGKENNEFITSCQTNRMFLSKKLTVRRLEVTAQVKVEDVSNIHKDVLMLYFENKGWEVVQITPDEEEQSAIISFKRAKDVQGIIKMKHLIGMKPVKEECDKIHLQRGQLKPGDCVITGAGGQLHCKNVIHVGYALKTMRDIVEDCLNKAELHNLTSITFPAIGTGNLGFPKHLAASVIIEESLKFKKRLFSKVTSAPGAHEMSIGHVRVQVVSGDITKETTDVIVNASNESFDLKIGVSKAILDAAGPTVEDECKVLGAQPNTEMILTKPGNLKCQRILHLPGRKDPKQIQQAMEAALLLAELNQYTSVSFPALGTGQGNAQVDQVADAMLDAVVDVVSQKAQGGLKVVRIVIFQAAMMKDFYSRMEKKAAADKQSTGLLGRVKAWFGVLPSVAKTQKDSDFVLDDLQIEPVCFHICGSSQANVNQAIRWITEQVSKEYTQTTIQEKAILNLSVPNYKQISTIQSSLSVSVKVDDTSITIEGLSKNVLKATNEIQKVLSKVREDDDIKRTLETISWQYQLPGFQFQNFDRDTNFLLEQAHTNKQLRVDADIEGRVYKVDVPNGPATDDQGNCLEIRRYDILKAQDEVNLPKLWEPMPQGAAYHNVLLLPETPEYTEVLKLFQATCPRPVVKIERTQNALLWKSLQIKRAAMDVTNSHQNNEKRLFHGACHTAIALINQYGFNRSYAGKNAACYGNGTYFAVSANYSAQDTYSKPDTQGQKHVYLCRVLTGDYTTGTQGMVVPPIKSPGVQYDSVVNNMNSIQMYIIFHDTQACPEYLITFK